MRPSWVSAGSSGRLWVCTANMESGLVAASPDGWADVSENALERFLGTQHLIGPQLVEVDGDQDELESYVPG